MTRAYRVLKDSELRSEAKAGVIVYPIRGYDYGLARDDTEATGVKHVSVTMKRSGGYPSFTIPLRDLEPIELEPLGRITDDHMLAACRPGAGAATCRYLTMSAKGFSCEKHSPLAELLDARVMKKDIVARGGQL